VHLRGLTNFVPKTPNVLPGEVIAACATEEFTLVTDNRERFPMLDLKLYPLS
jgi:hypothetical protein